MGLLFHLHIAMLRTTGMIGDECIGIMPTKIELTLKQSQQGVSNDVLVSIEGVETEKKCMDKVSKGKEASTQLKAETGSIHMLSESQVDC
ncbi:hypothetical protein Tco_0015410 [Tanacetum coccineum]